MKTDSLKEALIKIYIDNPCGAQPTALWKTLGEIYNFKSSYTIKDNEVTNIKLWNDNILHTYWHRDTNSINEEDILGFNMVLAHDSQINDQLKEKFASIESYFKLLHNNKDIIDIEIPNGYYIRNVDFTLEMQMVSGTSKSPW